MKASELQQHHQRLIALAKSIDKIRLPDDPAMMSTINSFTLISRFRGAAAESVLILKF